MVSGKGIYRLGKVARDFNVGTSTIVEFLQKKGHEVESNPNAKITDDQYALIIKEYSKEVDIKKESEKLNLRAHRHQKNETITIDDVVKPESDEDDNYEDSDEDVVRITDLSAKKSVKPSFVPKEEDHVKTEIPKKEFKIIGKIDLNAKPKPQIPEEKPKPETIPEPVAQQTVKQVSHPPKTVPKETKASLDEVASKKEPIPAVSNEKSEKKPVQAEPEKVSKQNPLKGQPEAKTPQGHEHKEKVEVAPKPTETINEIKTQIPKVENDLKVIGKIDLNSLNQRTRPPKKSKKQRDEERKARLKIKKVSPAEPAQPGETEPTMISHIPPKMGGPNVIGKIQLTTRSGEAANAQSDAAARKKKRKRISKERVDLSTNNGAEKPGEKKDASKKPQLKKDGIKGKKRIVRPEVSEEDVSRQVKDTLARLTSKTKSKGSKYRKEKRAAFSEKMALEEALAQQGHKIIKVTEFVSVNELATMMDVPATKVIAACMSLGLFVSINQRLDAETMSVVAEEFGFRVEFISAEVMEAIEEEADRPEDLFSRPPIVTVMGHVDHGKTSLLDYIRKTNVIAGEAGGITQHIGAYNVELADGRKITFLDTPGHEAFTAMRARGAQVTDIAIIIVAADDNVMPQTIEAINHAAAAGVPMVFAINKIDKPGANPESIKDKMANMNYLVESWGGKYQSHDISAKMGVGVDELLEKVLLEAEMLDLKANPDKRAVGSVIESALDKGRGYVSTILVQNGTLHEGDILLAGPYMGHVKAMFNERNQRIKSAGPAEPALVLGLSGAPQAGDRFNVMENEREARQIANKREQLQREQGMRTQKHITLDEIGRRIAIGNFKELNLIVKGDVDGSIEALTDSLVKLSTEQIQVNVKHKAVGQISESDVMLASASDAIIVGFQVRPSLAARRLAEQEQIDIRLYSIIYDAIEEIKAAMEGMLAPEIKEEITGTAEILEVFKITKVGTIAGCLVRDGKIQRNSKARVIRDGIVVFTGELGSLKRFKEDVKDVSTGYECGLNVAGYNDIKSGDFVECFKHVEVAKKL
jgi:translation initiation factor IF-2